MPPFLHKKSIWISLFISLVIIILSFFYSRGYLIRHQKNYFSLKQYQQIYQSTNNGLIIGSDDAPNKIEIYSSLLCRACANFSLHQLPEIINQYVKSNRAKIIIHPMPPRETMKASICAWQQGRLLEYEQYFFNHQQEFFHDQNSQEIISFSYQTKLNSDLFKKCYQDQNQIYNKIIQNWLNQSEKNKIKYTPTIFVNGKEIIYNGRSEVIDRIGEKLK